MRKLFAIFAILLFMALLAALAGILLSRGAGRLGSRAVVSVRLDGPLPDYSPAPTLPFLNAAASTSIASLFRAVERAKQDDRVAGLAVYVQEAAFGLGKAQEVRRVLRSLADAGKPVDCYLETAGEAANGTLEYYVASACDSLSLAPAGEMNLLGFYSASAFYRGALDKLKIEPDFAHVGDYKSAGETYTRQEHSAAAEEALGAVLDDLFAQLVGDIGERRGLEPAAVRALVDRSPMPAGEALAAGLVDALEYPDEFEARVLAAAGGGAELVTLSDYLGPPRPGHGRRVAVVFAQGTIVRGRGGIDPWSRQLYLGSDALAELLRDLAARPAIAAVVLRVDSPGGSALASDLMLREVERLAEHKPVVVSMSDVAASGGYYIAAKAARIVAQPATITGSIGVFGGKLVTNRFQEELLGVSHDPLARGAHAGFYSTLQPFTPEQAERFRRQMGEVYDAFVGHVSAGRGMSRDAVLAVAGGRIWTGRRASELGLVDELGGLARALELARRELGDDDTPGFEYFPKPPSLLDLLTADGSPLVTLGLERWAPLLAARALGAEAPPRVPGQLELSADLAALAHPF